MVRLWAYLLVMSLVAVAQTKQPETVVAKWQHEHLQVPCGDSPIPGRRPQNWDCAILVRREFSSLPPGAVSLRFETFPTRDAAEIAATPASVEVEAGQKVWLLTIGPKGERSEGGVFVTEVGPISIPAAPLTKCLSRKPTSVLRLTVCPSNILTQGLKFGISSRASNAWNCRAGSYERKPGKELLHQLTLQ